MLNSINRKTGRKFLMLRKREDINNTIDDFFNDFNLKINKIEDQSKLGFIRELYNVLLLYRDPKKNYDLFDNKWIDFDLTFGASDLVCYFTLSPTKKTDTNELSSIQPVLFEEASAFFIFLEAILISLREEILTRGQEKTFGNSTSSFSMLLTEEGKKILPYLQTTFKDVKKPLLICNMVFALVELKLISKSNVQPSTDFFNALQSAFGKIGSRQGIIFQLDDGNISPYRKSQIAKIVAELRNQLKLA